MIIRYPETIFIRASKKPGTPTGGFTDADYTPNDWTRRFSDRSGQGSTWVSRRTVTWSTDTGFIEASVWGSVRPLIGTGARDSQNTEYVYRRGTSTPSRPPSGGRNEELHLPSGWSEHSLTATATQNVYRTGRTAYYVERDGDEEFDRASNWGTPTLWRSKTGPKASISVSPSSLPAGGGRVTVSWSTSGNSDSSADLGVYGPGAPGDNAGTGNDSGSFSTTISSTSTWTILSSAPRKTTTCTVAQPTIDITTDTDEIFRLATSTPSAPSGGTSTKTHRPSPWSGTEQNPTVRDAVYRTRRTRTYHDGTFESATTWGNVTRVALKRTLTVSVTGSSSSLKEGSSRGFSANVGGTATGSTSYKWSVSGDGTISGSSSSSSIIVEADEVGSGNGSFTVSVTVTKNSGIASGSKSVPVRDVPDVVAPPGTTPTITASITSGSTGNINEGYSRTFGVNTEGTATGARTYRWSVSGDGTATSSSNTGSTYVVRANSVGSSGGRFTVSVTVTREEVSDSDSESIDVDDVPDTTPGVVVRFENDYCYRLGTSTPSTPTGGTSILNHRPSNWSRSQLTATSTSNVYRSSRVERFEDDSFDSATSWETPTVWRRRTGSEPDVIVTTNTDYVYRLAISTPSTPTGGTSSRTHTPSGWSRTEPNATATQGVYRVSRTRRYENGSFSSATSWGSISRITAPDTTIAPVFTNKFQFLYTLATSTPRLPPGGESSETHIPSFFGPWQRTEPRPTRTQNVYRISRIISYSDGVFSQASGWRNVTKIRDFVPRWGLQYLLAAMNTISI